MGTSINTLRLRDFFVDDEGDCQDKYGLSKSQLLPSEFLDALKGCLVAGLTCEEICAFLHIACAVHTVGKELGTRELAIRTAHVVEVMAMDIRD